MSEQAVQYETFQGQCHIYWQMEVETIFLEDYTSSCYADTQK